MGIGLSQEMIEKVPKDMLEGLYTTGKESIEDISQRYSIGEGTVYRLLKYHGIKTRRYEPYPDVKVLSNETEKAYFAGYLDGDGCITITMMKSPKARLGICCRPYVSLVGVRKEFMCELNSILGGGLRSFVYRDSREKKVGYSIHILRHESVLRFLEEILPYLKLKKRQAELLIEFCRKRIEDINRLGRSAPISDRCWQIAQEVRKLNE